MTGEVRHRMAVAVFVFIFLALPWATVHGAIFSLNKKRDVPQKIDFGQAERLLSREKRTATTTTTGPPGSGSHAQPNRVLIDEVVLNGTETQRHAYVHYSGKKKSAVIFILTVHYNGSGFADSQLWKSTDYGSTFTSFSFESDAQVSMFYVSPADPTKMVFIDGRNKKMYTTSDELATHQTVSLPVDSADEFYLHPTVSNWMAVLDLKGGELYVTQDFGASWKHMQRNVFQFFWGIPGTGHKHTVHLEVKPKDSVDSFYMRCTLPDCNSTDDGIDTNLGPFLPYTLLVSDEYIFAQKVLQERADSHLMVSYQGGNFSNTYFPASVKTQDFFILDTSEGQVFLAVNHGDRQGASLYLSDPKGQFYVLSLTNVHHTSYGHWFDVDMHKVKGLNGTYLANTQSDKNPNRLTSFISYDKGGEWHQIPSPKPDCHNDNCSFHLWLDMSNYFTNWILSKSRAPNLLVAHGQYGTDMGFSHATVFTSRDGGWTWTESSLKGIYHFNILDQGSIITAIETSMMENATQVYYSSDEGGTWKSEKFKNETLHVQGVLNEPEIDTLVLSVYGRQNYRSPWTLFKLNFSRVLSRKCQDEKDYRNWTLSDHDAKPSEVCILGQSVSYKLKKLDSICFNGEDFVRTVDKQLCECTAEDFECDFGFDLNDKGVCVQQSWFGDDFISRECTENRPYDKSKGYRKVGSDKCVGGLENNDTYKHISAPCPVVKPTGLLVTANVTVVAVGQPVLFHLIQKWGSVLSTKYVWHFGQYHKKNTTGLTSAQHQVKTFYYPAVFYVNVTASNANGTSTSNTLVIKAETPIRRVTALSVKTARVGDPVTVVASTSTFRQDTSLHYQFRFGDEDTRARDVLTYSSNATHVYNRTGTFTLTVTALNSVSAATKQTTIQIIDDGIVVRLTFSANVDRIFSGYYYDFYYLTRFQEELTKALGILQDRLALSLKASRPIGMDCLIVPRPPNSPSYEKTAEQIKQDLVDMVEHESLSLFVDTAYSRWYGDINITHVQIMDYSKNDSGHGNSSSNCTHGHNCTDGGHNCTIHGHNCTEDGHNCTNGQSHDCADHNNHGGDKSKINYRAVYIAVPVVVVAGLVSVIIIVIYRRRARLSRHMLLTRAGTADPYFDEEDDLPLDMSDARDAGDDRMLDIRTGN